MKPSNFEAPASIEASVSIGAIAKIYCLKTVSAFPMLAIGAISMAIFWRNVKIRPLSAKQVAKISSNVKLLLRVFHSQKWTTPLTCGFAEMGIGFRRGARESFT
ncbi:MAG: hypothetical protein IKE61_01920 [Coriobacteriales bacterium]|nr:hypothetical protein [Coriobacteriales bacterium]